MVYKPANPNGSATSANSAPVVIASDQATIPVSNASLPLPTGASTSANQATEITSLSTIATNTAANATSANQTNGTQQTKITDGTNVVNVVAGDTGFNSQAVSGGAKTITFTTSLAGAQTLLANTNVEGYSVVEIVYTSVGSGLTVAGQFSTISGGTYVSSNTFGTTSNNAPTSGLGSSAGLIYFSPVHGNFFQLAISALTSGTVTGTATFRALAPPATIIASSQTGTWTIQPGNTANTTPWLTRPSDGTNTANIKAASTAAAATDPALVVAISPNNTVPVSLATNTPVIAAGTNLIGKVGIDQTTVGTTNAVSLAQLGANTIATGNGTSSTGTLRVAIASDQTTNTNPLLVKQQAQPTGGATPFQLISAASTNATSVKASAGTLYGVQVYNNTATVAFLKIYNKASAPTVGTDTPVKTIEIPANGGSNLPITDIGIAFGTGIALAITGLPTVADTTAVTLAGIITNLDYV